MTIGKTLEAVLKIDGRSKTKIKPVKGEVIFFSPSAGLDLESEHREAVKLESQEIQDVIHKISDLENDIAALRLNDSLFLINKLTEIRHTLTGRYTGA